MEIKKILCAVDLMDSVNPAVEPAKQFAKLTGAAVTVLYVLSSSASHLIEAPVEPGEDDDDIVDIKGMSSRNSMMHAIWARTREEMDAFIKKHFPDMEAEGIIYEGKPAAMIVEVADAIGAGMIIIGTSAREKFFDRFFFGSVANEVVRTAGCYVLTTRPTEKTK